MHSLSKNHRLALMTWKRSSFSIWMSSCRALYAKYYSLVTANEAFMAKIEPASVSGAEALAEVVTAALRMQYEPVEDEISLAEEIVLKILWQ